jgi:hypothetical protein
MGHPYHLIVCSALEKQGHRRFFRSDQRGALKNADTITHNPAICHQENEKFFKNLFPLID